MTKARPKFPSLTDGQIVVLVAVHESCSSDAIGRSPTIRRLSINLGLAKQTVFQYLEALHRHGCIENEPNVARSIRLTDTGVQVVQAVQTPSTD